MGFWVHKKLKNILFGLGVFLGICGNLSAEGFDFVASGLSLEKATTQAADKHPMPLSAIKRVSNRLMIESQTDVVGTRSNYLYRVSEATSLDKAVGYYKELLSDQGRIEFACEQRNCGASNHWANDIFGNRNLAGRDSDQSYFAGRLDDGVHQGWLSVYAVTNARRIDYIYISFIPAPPEDYVADAKRGVLLGEAVLSKDWAKALGDYLQANANAKLVVVAFSKPVSSAAQLGNSIESSAEYGETMLVAAREAIGVDGSRVELRSMGMLGQRPLGFNAQDWAYLYLVD
ncbi:hypothetical protein A3742_01450 [Oleiphilus sp. HI0071]|uniref:DUF4892 domain-containing protein n=1 Tax=unclassified Oleiphilus TaxID=2631174 RepID=UPI0007C37221|nr:MULTISPECIES: DUF4892 domain-containing protein [unclassified Oleiphilus]KZY74877.1 hypothetical protein A3737_01010 [Oleiphilus sp. HI0065]KZY82040.1 hypothetical protein A3742_01450 [Oleiphilus sp. HI0071]KZY91170.1 hypothetical protein A3744_04705 [Oleiphilus sp. HI0073]KZZ42192.1 hypothetical protein A3758_06350 [Oleiphilus sp. HI0118]KZZ60361.1 hypothetical protein A3760_05720 [Oleiphilus sp. HI0122]KZZ64835.1 hypothetical protein A3765_06660 [Oleiphilus sp. HI0130]KZZ81997.1 hypothe